MTWRDVCVQRVQTVTRLGQDEQQLADQALEIKLLLTRLSAISRQLTAAGMTTSIPPTSAPPPVTTFAVPTPRPPGGGAQTTPRLAVPTPLPHNG